MKKFWQVIIKIFVFVACKFSKHNKNENIDLEKKSKK